LNSILIIPFVQRDFLPAPAQPPEPEGCRKHDKERGHHQVEEGVDKSRVRSAAGGEGVETFDSCIGIEMDK